ncbi:MAG TPA: HupE/UreJ family protein [Candidatus Limnocylindrales bacterium]|nr:HupE/UreJ family protein [Candidatus Limnocylindrales bacterium]
MKLVVTILLMALLNISGIFEHNVKAHELIPKEVLEYVQNNPDATPEEIENFTRQNAPEFSENTKGGEDIIRIAQDQDASLLDNSLDFIQLGIQHILSGPDHILFVLTLLLAFISIGKTLKLVTAFTLAHSITLILAGASILTLSSQIVEPLIALSISIMAVTTVFFRNNKYVGTIQAKAGIVFFFGLFHGLGFAGLLQEIQVPSDKFLSSLIAFNIGIEIGQIIIIMLALPFILLFKNKPWYNRLIQIFAGTIAAIGIVWALQRAFGF